MTDYYPPLQRAVEALASNTAEARRALYERARNALLKQLRGMDPALSESQITKERLLLEDAIRKVETETARVSRPRRETTSSAPSSSDEAASPDSSRKAPLPHEDDTPPEKPGGPPPARHDTPGPAQPEEDKRDASKDSPKRSDAGRPPPPPRKPAPERPRRERPIRQDRPPAPRRRQGRPTFEPKLYVAAGAVLLLAVGGTTIYLLKEDDSSFPSPPAAVQTSPAVPGSEADKVSERLTPNGIETGPPATPARAPQSPLGAQPLSPITQRQPAAAPQARAMLREAGPTGAQQSSAIGTVAWHTESVPGGPGRGIETAIRGEVAIPERQLQAILTLKRNTDAALPASHTLEIQFIVPQDFSDGGIQNLPGVLMKPGEAIVGMALSGMSVKVTNGYFLVGLANPAAETGRNEQLLKERTWIDIHLEYNTGRKAILTLEKGPMGEKLFLETMAQWESSANR